MDRKYVSLSKKMSLALRHDPDKFGIELNIEGWTKLLEFFIAMGMNREDLNYIMENSNKQRFEIKNDPVCGEMIRAYYGHSLDEKIRRTPVEPPEFLYHGTPPRFSKDIQRDGIKPMGRQYAHHSTDVKTAFSVGSRRSPNPVIFVIRALEAHRNGVKFYEGNEDIWLSDEIPAKYLDVHRRETSKSLPPSFRRRRKCLSK